MQIIIFGDEDKRDAFQLILFLSVYRILNHRSVTSYTIINVGDVHAMYFKSK